MKRLLSFIFIFFAIYINGQVIIDHTCTDITQIPQSAIQAAKDSLHIGYGHTSHGGQVTDGMTGLVDFANNGGKGLSLPDSIFAWNSGGVGGALDLLDGSWPDEEWLEYDLGYYPEWYNETVEFLDTNIHSDYNVIIWSWCSEQIGWLYYSGHLWDEYLEPMTQLEIDYPNVAFVYMTACANINYDEQNKAANDSIRSFCQNNGKVLYDFADIERWDPDGNYYEFVDDSCNYYDSVGGTIQGNWAVEWQNSHTEGVDWYDCRSQHTEPLSGNLKAYAAWWLWARLAGWEGGSGIVENIDERVELNINQNIFLNKIRLDFYLSVGGLVEIKLVDITGRIASNVLEGNFSRGSYSYTWRANGIKSGAYLLVLTHPSGQISKKTIILEN